MKYVARKAWNFNTKLICMLLYRTYHKKLKVLHTFWQIRMKNWTKVRFYMGMVYSWIPQCISIDLTTVFVDMPPWSKIEAYCFCSVCHSIILSETLTLLESFELWVLELWYYTWVFLMSRTFRWYHYLLYCDLHLLKNFNLANYFWAVREFLNVDISQEDFL